MTPKGRLAVSKIVLIGCGGFVGSHILDRLVHCPDLELVGCDSDDQRIRQHVGRPGFPVRDGDGVPRVLASFMAALLDGTPIQVVDGGSSRRTIVSIHDAVRAVLLMLEKPDKARNQIFNLGNRDDEVTVLELAHLMERIDADASRNPKYKDHPIEFVSSKAFYGEGYEDCDRRMPSVEKASEQLGWRPEVRIEDILEETIEYYHGLYGQPGSLTATLGP